VAGPDRSCSASTGTHTGYLYAVGHAAGTKTVIKGLGKVPLTFTDWNYFRFAPSYDPLNGA
jgi:hypothetical protein